MRLWEQAVNLKYYDQISHRIDFVWPLWDVVFHENTSIYLDNGYGIWWHGDWRVVSDECLCLCDQCSLKCVWCQLGDMVIVVTITGLWSQCGHQSYQCLTCDANTVMHNTTCRNTLTERYLRNKYNLNYIHGIFKFRIGWVSSFQKYLLFSLSYMQKLANISKRCVSLPHLIDIGRIL